MRYPSAEDYMKALQQPVPFTTDDLRRMELVVHPVFQIPTPAAGTSAVVFKAVADGEAHALRLFTRDDNWSGERYTALHDHFTATGLASAMAMPTWVHDGVWVNGRTWPIVRMQWIEGHTLNKYVEDLVQQGDSGAIAALAGAWLDLIARLQRAEFAHGDLQHGNVMVDTRGEMRLVDFDCSWIARFSGLPAPNETGHRNYQLAARAWGPWMDTFPGLVVYTSLLALSKDSNPWHALHNGENLLFRDEDFHPPFQTPTWAQLAGIQDRELEALTDRLKECCTPGWIFNRRLQELLAPRERPWWERTPAAAGAASAAPQPLRAPRSPLPPPTPTRWPAAAHSTSGPIPGPRPTQNWWQQSPALDPRRQARAAGRSPRLGVIIAVALVLGFTAGGFCGAAIEGAGGPGVIGLPFGLLVALFVLLVGFTRRAR